MHRRRSGFDVEWYERAGTLWVIRRTIADFLAPVRLPRRARGAHLGVGHPPRALAARVRGVARRRDATLVARGSTDWVYVDLARGAPVRPPDEMRATR